VGENIFVLDSKSVQIASELLLNRKWPASILYIASSLLLDHKKPDSRSQAAWF